MDSLDLELNTRLVHGGENLDPTHGAVAPVLVRSKTYRQPKFGEDSPWKYGRGTNPTRMALEAKLAAIEGEGQALVFGSGLAAITNLLFTFKPGSHILFSREIYGGTYRLLDQVFDQYGLTFSFANFESRKEVLSQVKPETCCLFVETPSNPSMHVTDLALAGSIARETGLPLIVDGTFAPPVTTRAFEFGAETIVYSLSKYFGGHNDVVAGAIVTKNPELYTRLKFLQSSVGAILSPDECYRVIQGIKTLQLRWERSSSSALKLAAYLGTHPAIKRSLYPGLPDHPGYEVASRQMKSGMGAVVGLETHCQDQKKLRVFVESVQERGTVIYAESLASPETLLAYPLQMSHRAVPPEDLKALGITPGFFRLSLGFEDPEDIIEDFRRGLDLLL